MSDSVCIKANVRGIVQGVFFRQSTLQQANKLTLTGWVQNQADGSVSLVACGNQANIDALLNWLQHEGPPSAEISDIDWDTIANQSFKSFEIRY